MSISSDIQGQIFVKFTLKNFMYLQGSHLWMTSSLLENGSSSFYASFRAWVVLLPPFSFPLLIPFTFFGNKSSNTYSSSMKWPSLLYALVSSSLYDLPAIYILIPWFPFSFPPLLPPLHFSLFPFLVSLHFVHLFSAPCPGGGFML
jgi:hypothetical protein